MPKIFAENSIKFHVCKFCQNIEQCSDTVTKNYSTTIGRITHDMVHVLVINLEHNHDEMWLATLTNVHCVLQMVNCSVNHINKMDGEDSSYSYSENQFTR